LGATFLSGTTISNSLTELYLLFKYLRPKALEKQDIRCFDAWAAIFAKKTTDFEFNVTNSIVQKERFRYFIKVPELAAVYKEINDYRTAGGTGVGRAEGEGESGVVDIHIPPNQYDIIVFAGQGAALVDMAENPGKDLSHLGAGDVVFGTKIAIGIPCDKLPLHHRADIIVGPRTDLVGIRELGQVLTGRRHQAESTGNHNDCLLPGDVVIRLHQPVAVSGQGSHVDGLRDVVGVTPPTPNPLPADFHSCEVMGGRGSDFQWLVPLALANFTGTFVSRQPLLREGQAYAEIRRYGIYDATTVDEWSENNNDNS